MNKIPDKKAENVALTGIVLSVIFLIFNFVLASYCNSSAAKIEGFQFIAIFLVWGISWLHLRSFRLANEEKMALEEAERIRKEQGRQKLFDSEDISSSVAQSRLREMEKYGATIAGLLIIAFQAIIGGTYLAALLSGNDTIANQDNLGLPLINEELSNTTFASGITFGISFICFLFGKYAAGMSKIRNFHILRAGAGFTLVSAILNLLLAASFLMGYYGYLWGDKIVAIIITAMLIILSFEMLINLVLDFYRPRIAGKIDRPVYESRIASLIAQPEGILHTFSQTLDYQFGFNVSETWFFKFINKAIAPLILFQLATLYLLTSIVIVEPGEVAIIERWGRPRGIEKIPGFITHAGNSEYFEHENDWDKLEEPLTEGFHLKLPWPVESAKIVKKAQIQEIQVGASQEEIKAMANSTNNLVTWDVEHQKGEFKYAMPLVGKKKVMPTSSSSESQSGELDVMFVSGAIRIQYAVGRYRDISKGNEIIPGDVYRYLYRYVNPRQTLISISEREITSYMAGANFWNVLVDNVVETEKNLKDKIQHACDKAGIGIRIIFVSLSNVHPPVGEVGKSYQAVVAAKQEKETSIYKAMATAAEKTAATPGEAASIKNSAKGYYDSRVLVAEAVSKRFQNQMTAYESAPSVYLHREKMAAIEEGLEKSGKTVLIPPSVTAVIDDKEDAAAQAIDMALIEESNKQ